MAKDVFKKVQKDIGENTVKKLKKFGSNQLPSK
jgi:hypothetical protein